MPHTPQGPTVGSGLTARATYAAYRTGAAVAMALPSRVATRLARSAGRASSVALAERRALVARHQQRVHGGTLSADAERRQVRQVFESYARYWLEAFRLPEETPASISARMDVEGRDHLDAAYRAGEGVLLATAHLGGWDFGAAWLAVEGYQPLAVVEQLDPPELFEWFASWRRRLGLEIVPTGPAAATAVLEGLRQGRTIGLVSDRDLQGNGVEVEFFGEPTRLPGGPAVLALRTGAPLLPVAVLFQPGDRHLAVIRAPIPARREGRFRDDVTRITQAMARELESLIRRAPDQWHLLQPNWPSDPGWRHGPTTPADADGREAGQEAGGEKGEIR